MRSDHPILIDERGWLEPRRSVPAARLCFFLRRSEPEPVLSWSAERIAHKITSGKGQPLVPFAHARETDLDAIQGVGPNPRLPVGRRRS